MWVGWGGGLDDVLEDQWRPAHGNRERLRRSRCRGHRRLWIFAFNGTRNPILNGVCKNAADHKSQSKSVSGKGEF